MTPAERAAYEKRRQETIAQLDKHLADVERIRQEKEAARRKADAEDAAVDAKLQDAMEKP